MEISQQQIIDLSKQIAQQVVDKLHRAPLTYNTPATISDGLQHSMSEELTASNWYHQRAVHARNHGDNESARLYEDIAGDEDEHYREFSERLQQIVKTGVPD
ncbi:MAG: ferritin-like domain-containing protein [Dehalococcoidales bacterium]|nr:ferritin-like domain-containing protein [Dehalococcoidales bacterium]